MQLKQVMSGDVQGSSTSVNSFSVMFVCQVIHLLCIYVLWNFLDVSIIGQSVFAIVDLFLTP